MKIPTPEIDTLLRTKEVIQITGRSRSSIFRDIEKGRFPSPVKIGPKSNAWRQSEIATWMAELPRRSHGGES